MSRNIDQCINRRGGGVASMCWQLLIISSLEPCEEVTSLDKFVEQIIVGRWIWEERISRRHRQGNGVDERGNQKVCTWVLCNKV